MKDNGPVTQKEYKLPENTTIVSRTDTFGNIIEANESFIEASGYDWKELVGQPHNILRHPDVPEAVFADFWATIQAGKPWTQIVKNRRKNGDHYWVVANATPTYENGEISGFMSVRTPASREQIAAAEQAYQAVATGKLKLTNGVPNSTLNNINPVLNANPAIMTAALAMLLLIAIIVPIFFKDVLEFIPLWVFEAIDVILIVFITAGAIMFGKKLETIRDKITAIAEGKFDNEIDSRGTNVLGQIASRLKSMQIKLGADIVTIKSALASSQRIENALKASSSPVMVLDRFNSIIFANTAMQSFVSNNKVKFESTFPNFKVAQLNRSNFNLFAAKTGLNEQFIQELRKTHQLRFEIDNLTIDMTIDPIFDQQGQRIGTVTEWKDITERLAIENNIEDIITSAAKGSLSKRLQTADLTGFELSISNSINLLLNNINESFNNLNNIFSKLASGDLRERMQGDYEAELLAMKTSTNNALNNLSLTMNQISSGANQIGNMASEVATASEDLSQRTQEQAASLEETSATMEELTSTLEQSTNNSHQANELAQGAAKNASDGIQVMNKTLGAMSDITELSKKIGEITSVIDSIAFQTNLLALNAAVEAARAGEHGRGFAVVAGEVRSLAGKSADAAKDISNMINTTIEQISTGTHLVEETNSVFEDMVHNIQEVSGLINEVATTSSEQAKGIQQVNIAIRQLDEVTQQNAALVEELSATASNMSGEAEEQSNFVNRFKFDRQTSNVKSNPIFTDAKLKHNAWNSKLEQFLTGQASDINETTARQKDACDLGRWIYSDGKQFMQLPEMQELEKLHAEFHTLVGKVIDASKLDDMEVAKQYKSQVYQLSQEVIALLDKVEAKVASEKPQPTALAPSKTHKPNKEIHQEGKDESEASMMKPAATINDSSSQDEWAEF